MKTIRLFLFSGCVLLMSAQGWATGAACGNGSQHGNAGTKNDKGSDPIVVFTANEYREVRDLQLWAGAGQHRLTWSRWANSRLPALPQSSFGNAHNWRHGYQWDMVDEPNDAQGRKRILLVDPHGNSMTFTQVAPQLWRGTAAVQEVIHSNEPGTELTLRTPEGWEYRFVKYTAGNSSYYLMEDFRDSHDNLYDLQYDASRRLVKVVEPAGRYLEIAYGSESQTTSRWGFWNGLATVPASPAPGQWIELNSTNTGNYRYVKIRAADGKPLHVAEVEFYDTQGNRLQGTAFGSSPAAEAGAEFDKALDGDPMTHAAYTLGPGGFVGIDLGQSKVIGSVRVLPRPGFEQELAGARILGSHHRESVLPLITQVSTSDGRSVSYHYEAALDPAVPALAWVKLTGVHYGDGTQAVLTYTQVYPGTRPLVESAIEPRYHLPFAKTRSEYWDTAQAALGQIKHQRDFAGNILSSLGIAADGHNPVLSFPWGGKQQYTYPVGGRKSSFIDGLGRKSTYVHDENGRGYLISETDPLGRTTTTTRTFQGNIATRTLPDGTVETWTYDARERPLSQTLSGPGISPRTTNWTRDAHGRVTRVDYPDGAFETFTYNSFGQITSQRLRNGGQESFTYDSRGLLTSKTDALGLTTTYTYDASDRVATVTDPRGHTTATLYNERGLVTQITYADATTRIFAYDAFGNKTSETNELGATWTWVYDDFKRPIAATDPLGRTTQTIYLPGNWTQTPDRIVLPSGKETRFTYDAERQLTRTAWKVAGDTVQTVSTVEYDLAGNPVVVRDALNKATTSVYDTRNRRVNLTDPLGRSTTFTHDAAGNVLTTTRPDGGVTTNTYDAMNRLTSTQNPKSETTNFSYDSGDNMVSLTDAKGNAYTFEYDLLNRRTKFVYPGSAGDYEQWTYTDTADTTTPLMVYRARDGSTMSCIYDNRGRETFCDYSDPATPDVTNTYDAAGRKLSCSTSVASHTYTCNTANELLSETTSIPQLPNPLITGYAYTSDGLRASLTYPDGSVVNYAYTARNQVKEIAAAGPPPLATYAYDPNGNRVAKTLENGTSASYSYDSASRLTQLKHVKADATLAQFDYTLNSVGNRTAKNTTGSIPNQSESYSYDAIDQLTSAAYGPSRTVTFSYDPVGNRQTTTDSSSPSLTSYSTNALNQYTEVGSQIMTYDAKGNLEASGTAGVMPAFTFDYDSKNRLLMATVGAASMTVTYDCQNRPVSRTINGVTTYLIHDGWNLIAEYDALGVLKTKYVHGSVIDEILAKIDNTGTVYYHHDGLGSTIALTNAVGNVVESYQYDVFGKVTMYDASNSVISASSVLNRFLYTGREFLQEVGLYDYRNRVYSAELGRFLQTDPIRFDAGDVNLYRYVGNSTLIYIDPYGNIAFVGATIGGLGGAISGFTSGLVSSGGGMGAAVRGAVIGGAVGAAVGAFDPTGGIAAGAVGGAAAGAINAAMSGNATAGSIAAGAAVGAGMGAVGAAATPFLAQAAAASPMLGVAGFGALGALEGAMGALGDMAIQGGRGSTGGGGGGGGGRRGPGGGNVPGGRGGNGPSGGGNSPANPNQNINGCYDPYYGPDWSSVG